MSIFGEPVPPPTDWGVMKAVSIWGIGFLCSSLVLGVLYYLFMKHVAEQIEKAVDGTKAEVKALLKETIGMLQTAMQDSQKQLIDSLPQPPEIPSVENAKDTQIPKVFQLLFCRVFLD